MPFVTVIADSSGAVARIEAAPGDKVTQDDVLVILEAMKMEIPVEAGVAGVVKEILVEECEAVEEGDEVATIETP